MPNLVLVHWPGRQSLEDLQSLGRRVQAMDAGIHVFICDTKHREPLRAAMRATVGVSFMPVRRFRLFRGRM